MSDLNPLEPHEEEIQSATPSVSAEQPPNQPELPEFPSLTAEEPEAAPPAAPAEGYEVYDQAPKKPRKIKLWIPLAAVAALLAVVLLAGNAIALKIAPKAVLSRATAKLTASVEKRLERSPYQAYVILGNNLLTGGKVTGDIVYNDGWTDMQMKLEGAASVKDGSFLGGVELITNSVPLDAKLFYSRNALAMSSSYLKDNWYGITYDSFEEDFRASVLPDMFGMTDESIEEVAEVMDQLTDIMDRDYEALLKPYIDLFQDFYEELDAKTDTANAKVGGKEVKCDVIRLRVSDAQMRQLVTDLADTLADDENLREAYVASQMSSYGYTQTEAEHEYDMQMADLRNNVRETVQSFEGELWISYYLYKNQVVLFSVEADVSQEGMPLLMNCTYDFGCDPSKDPWSISGNFGEEATISLRYESAEEGEEYEDVLDLTVFDGYSNMVMTVANQWNRKTGQLLSDVTLDEGYGGETVRLESNLLCQKNEFTFSIDDAAALNMDEESEFLLKLTVGPAEKITAPQYKNLNQWDETVVKEFEAAYMDLITAMYGPIDDWE